MARAADTHKINKLNQYISHTVDTQTGTDYNYITHKGKQLSKPKKGAKTTLVWIQRGYKLAHILMKQHNMHGPTNEIK